MPEDRRIRHSKERIENAMIECLMQMSLDHITVKKLCEVADVNRSTFYAHYTDPYDLYQKMEHRTIGDLTAFAQTIDVRPETYRQCLIKNLSYMAEHADMMRVLLKTNSESFFQYSKKMLAGSAHWKDFRKEDADYISGYYISGVQSIIYQWLSGGQRESQEHIAELIFQLTKP